MLDSTRNWSHFGKDLLLTDGLGGVRFCSRCLRVTHGAPSYRGTSLMGNIPPPEDPTVALCLGTYSGPMGVGVSCERGTPVGGSAETDYAGQGVQL